MQLLRWRWRARVSSRTPRRRPRTPGGRRRRRRRTRSAPGRCRLEVAPDLLDLDPRGLVDRETADAGAEGDQRQRAGAELVGLGERARGGGADDLGRGRSAELHGRGVDHPLARHLAGAGRHRLAETDRRQRVALVLDARGRRRGRSRRRRRRRACRSVLAAFAIASTSSFGDVGLPDLDLRHRGADVRPRRRLTGARRPAPRG